MNQEEAEQLRELAQKILGLTDREAQGFMLSTSLEPAPLIDLIVSADETHSDLHLLKAAQSELERRRLRKRFLPADWFSEGPWNILVDLYDNEYRGNDVSVTSACIAAELPATTALRHIGQLIEAGLVQRVPDQKDNRRSFLRLSHNGRRTMRELLGSMIDAEASVNERLSDRLGKSP